MKWTAALGLVLLFAVACSSSGPGPDRRTSSSAARLPSPTTTTTTTATATATATGTPVTDGARKLLEADGAGDSELPAYVKALSAVGSHCQDGPYGTSIIVDTAVSTLESDGATTTRLDYLRLMSPSLSGATNADCTGLSLTIQTDLAYGDAVPSKILVATHPAVSGAPNLTDCESIHWPVAIPGDVIGQTLDAATTELVCFNVDATQSDGYDPLDHGSDNSRLGEWIVTAVTPPRGTRVGESTPVLLHIKHN